MTNIHTSILFEAELQDDITIHINVDGIGLRTTLHTLSHLLFSIALTTELRMSFRKDVLKERVLQTAQSGAIDHPILQWITKTKPAELVEWGENDRIKI